MGYASVAVKTDAGVLTEATELSFNSCDSARKSAGGMKYQMPVACGVSRLVVDIVFVRPHLIPTPICELIAMPQS